MKKRAELEPRERMNFDFAKACDRAKTNRDQFRAVLIDIRERRKRGMDEINKNFKPNSEMKAKAVYDLEFSLKSEMLQAKERAKQGVVDVFERLLDEERQAISTMPNAHVLNSLAAVSRLDVSEREFSVLTEAYRPYGFWAAKALRKIADEKGFSADGLCSRLDDKIDVLVEMGENFRKFVDQIESADSRDGRNDGSYYELQAGVSDDVIDRAKTNYTMGSREDAIIGDNESVRRLLRRVESAPSAFEAGMMLRDGYDKLSDNAKTALVCNLATLYKTNADMLDIAGLSDAVMDAQIDGTAKEYYQAQRDFKSVESFDDAETAARWINERSENAYIMDMVRSAARTSKVLANALEMIGEQSVDQEVMEDAEYEAEQ